MADSKMAPMFRQYRELRQRYPEAGADIGDAQRVARVGENAGIGTAEWNSEI
jgi:hypothetical protein